ncbi:CBO0543 family protein [Alkalihalobacillus sp. AL-G]|uniref:CBO0543 family protein n=1 Tax=Alkalihalobacillus sp. AL-G TaxID=2926399 RepID=UPI00272C1F5E|nr:CBO0543 family protein [Alkalihalobacillus sp. AL-G]WLD93674.1 hypothetical protein MOJ78_01760 [Alkalihalobacillus sp. AL-G]
MNILLFIVYGLIGLKFGKWKNFNVFYPTLLFFIIGDLLYQFLLFEHTMWMFHPVGLIDKWFHLNHTLIVLGKMMIQYPVTIAIFLAQMPSDNTNKLLWVGLWSGIYAVFEGVAQLSGILTYHRGWHYGWDLIFNVIIFSMLLLHHKKPLIAWFLCIPIILGLWWIFDVPFSVLK